ncbi:chemotaxis protein CheW [Colwellia psychrerythraea]|uniref:CheW protein n=1 Tax=Colwellia psychrerythraea TaxID=28229 RepID=A0A099KKM2_COLPS|nr:chemotaxis protein CheW [Colwellia psychrerythraea]KGJ91359.1 CheW protein [Colwellia psychrerythraea]
MGKSLTASKKIMKNYLSELLSEPEVAVELPQQRSVKKTITRPLAQKENHSLESLLKTVSEPKQAEITKEVTINDSTEVELLPTSSEENLSLVSKLPKKSYRQGDFQAMFFEVAGLTIAVPLIELGGIHKVDKTNSLMGKPDWFKGVMLYRDEKINVVDTALWVMPEKCDQALKDSLNYQYIIMLNDSSWGLMAEQLVDTVVLSQDEVKWLDSNEKRPWLAGLVKEKMCALLDVSALIELLNKGSDINQK